MNKIYLVLSAALVAAACSKKSSTKSPDGALAATTAASATTPTSDPGPTTSPAPAAPAEAANTDVIPVPVGAMLLKAAHPFDLGGKLLRFTPLGPATFKTEVQALVAADDHGTELTADHTQGAGENNSWKVTLPFAFPFGGASYTVIYANARGNISFDKPEHEYWSQRDPWADGGVRSVAAAVDLRSAAGLEKMIAPLWGSYWYTTKIYERASSTEALFTWVAPDRANSQSISTFQLRIKADGSIEFLYPDVKMPDGFAGVFPGNETDVTPVLVDETTGPVVPGTDPSMEASSLKLYEDGTLLHFALELKAPVTPTVATGTRSYNIDFDFDRPGCTQFGVNVARGTPTTGYCGEPPRSVTYEMHGNTLDVWTSKLYLRGAKSFKYWANTVWWDGPPGAFGNIGAASPHTVAVSQLQNLYLDLSEADGATSKGNVFELFHKAQLSRNNTDILYEINKTHHQGEDFAVVLTDFPIDDLFGAAGGSGAMNVPIQGIGPTQASPTKTDTLGFGTIQGTMAVTYAGDYHFDPPYMDGIHLINHEIGHRWGMQLAMIHPVTKARVELHDTDGHWIRELDQVSSAVSIMAGARWIPQSDGTYTRKVFYEEPSVYANLDLYAMGLKPKSELPTFALYENVQDLGDGRFSATKVPFTIDDVVAAMGERDPPATGPQTMKLRLYLVYDGDAPRPAMLERVEGLNKALREAFKARTEGRLTME